MDAHAARDNSAPTSDALELLRDQIQQLRHLADHDALTGIPNRRRMLSDLKHLSTAPESLSGFCLVDLDDFKVVNDTLGYLAGDELLVSVATRICAALAGKGNLYRLGGDEFGMAVLRPFTPREMALVVHRSLAQPVSFSAPRSRTAVDSGFVTTAVRVTASIGIAEIPEGEFAVEQLIAAADADLHRSKKSKPSHIRRPSV